MIKNIQSDSNGNNLRKLVSVSEISFTGELLHAKVAETFFLVTEFNERTIEHSYLHVFLIIA